MQNAFTNGPEIRICPVKRLYQLLETQDCSGWGAIISSTSPVDMEKLEKLPYVFRQYADVDYECPGRSFSREDAAAFAGFLKGLSGGHRILYCCCDAGESRSPAVAAVALRYFGRDDLAIWENPQYHPNMLVFDMLMRQLGAELPDEEKDTLLYINHKAFADAIKAARK